MVPCIRCKMAALGGPSGNKAQRVGSRELKIKEYNDLQRLGWMTHFPEKICEAVVNGSAGQPDRPTFTTGYVVSIWVATGCNAAYIPLRRGCAPVLLRVIQAIHASIPSASLQPEYC